MKKRGMGEGKWNGTGGKVEEGETIDEAARRETFEEVGVKIKEMDKVAVIIYEPYAVETHIYLVRDWEGEPVETEEMAPKWFNKRELPFDKMWEADIKWIPSILEGKKIKARFVYDKDNHILEESIEEQK